MPAVLLIMVMAVASSSSLTAPPICATIWGIVGISVGITTPLVELNQLNRPEQMPIMDTAVLSFITETSAALSILMPP